MPLVTSGERLDKALFIGNRQEGFTLQVGANHHTENS